MMTMLTAMAMMIASEDCVAAGDSLAVGVARAINAHVVGTSCRIAARKGEPASRIRRTMPSIHADVVILSAGANDPASPTLIEDLRSIRWRVRARQVIWVIPADPRAARAVRVVCRTFRDTGVDLSRFRRGDGVHPSDYWSVARWAFASNSC